MIATVNRLGKNLQSVRFIHNSSDTQPHPFALCYHLTAELQGLSVVS